MSLNQTSPLNTPSQSKKVVSVNVAAHTTTGTPSVASMPFPPNRNPSMPGASTSEVPNHLPRASPNPPAAGSPTAHARTTTSASVFHAPRSTPLHSTTAFAASPTSASASFVNTGDSKHNPSGKTHTSPRSAPRFGEETTHTHRSTPLHSTSTHRNQTSQATIGGRMGASSGPESKKEAVGSLQTANGDEDWTTVQPKARAPATPKVVVFTLNGKKYEFALDPENRANILVKAKNPEGRTRDYSICKRNFEECTLNPDFSASQASCRSEHQHNIRFCKNFHTGRKCSATSSCAGFFHLVLPSPVPSAAAPSGARGETVVVVPSAAPKAQPKAQPTITLTMNNMTYTFPLDHKKVGVEVKTPNGTTTVWVCANWFEKTVFTTDFRTPQSDCCGGNHGRIFCKNVFTGRDCTEYCARKKPHHMVLPKGIPLPAKVVAEPAVLPSADAFPALASDKTLKEQGAVYAVIQEKMKVTPTVRTAPAAPAAPAEETKVHPDRAKFHSRICNSVLNGTECKFLKKGFCYFAHPKAGEKFQQRVTVDNAYRAEFDEKFRAGKLDFQGIFEEVADVMKKNAESLRLLACDYIDDKKALRVVHLLAEKSYLVPHLFACTIEERHFEDLLLLWLAAAKVARADDHRISKNRVGSFILFGEENGPKENEVWELARRVSVCKTSFKYARKCAHLLPVVAEVQARADPEYAEKFSSNWRVSNKNTCTGGLYCDKGAHCDSDTTNYIDLDILSGKKSAPVPECTVLALPRDVPPRFSCQALKPETEAAAATAEVQLKETTETYTATYLRFLDVKKELDAFNAPPVEEKQRRELQGKCDAERKKLETARDALNETKEKKNVLVSNKSAHDKLVARLKEETRTALEAAELRLSQLTESLESESEPESSEEDEDDICFEESEPETESESESESEPEDESELTGDDIIAKLFKTATETNPSADITKELKKDLNECTERCATLREAVSRFVDPAFPTLKLSIAKRFPVASEKDRKQLDVLESTTLRYDEKIAVFDAEIALADAKCAQLEAVVAELRQKHKAAVKDAIVATEALTTSTDTTANTIRFRDLSTECIRLEESLYNLRCKMDALNNVVFTAKSAGICPVTSWSYKPLKPLPRKDTQLVAKFDIDSFSYAPSGALASSSVVAVVPALTGFGAIAANVPLQAITYPTTQSTDKAPVALQSVKPRKERTCEEVVEEDVQKWCTQCKDFGCILCMSGSQDQLAFGNFGACVFYPCERARKVELKELERAHKAGTTPVCTPFECPESDCPYLAHRLKMTKKNETALALLAVRPAPKAPKPKLLAIEGVDFDACEQVPVEVEIAEVVVDDKLSLAAFIKHVEHVPEVIAPVVPDVPKVIHVVAIAAPVVAPVVPEKCTRHCEHARRQELKAGTVRTPFECPESDCPYRAHRLELAAGLVTKPKVVAEVVAPAAENIVDPVVMYDEAGISVHIDVQTRKNQSTTTLSFPAVVPPVEVLRALANKLKKMFATSCTLDEEEMTLSLRGALHSEIKSYIKIDPEHPNPKAIDFAETVTINAPTQTTTKAEAASRASKKSNKVDTRDVVVKGRK